MIKCSKCNEYIGDNLEICPFCKHQITKEEKLNAEIEADKLHSEAVYGAISLRRKRMLIEVCLVVLWAILIFIVYCFTAEYDYYPAIEGATIVVFIGLYYLAIIKFKIECCPYCDSYIYTGLWFKKYCPSCGARWM